MGDVGGVYLANPFERLSGAHARPDYVIEPLSIAWNAVVFQVSGSRRAVVCVPRGELHDFLDRLHAGELDESIGAFLDTPPASRVLRASKQAETTGLFDELAAPDAAVPAERVPGRARGIGGRGGSPRDEREHKGRRRGRVPRSVVAIGAVVAVLAAGGIAVALSGGSSTKTAAATTTTTSTTLATTTTRPPDLVAADLLEGQWTVTRTITASTNPTQPVGEISVVKYTVTKICATSCTLHLDAPGSLGAHEDADLTFANGTYSGPTTGESPCTDDAGNVLSVDAITGSVSLTPTDRSQFTGVLDLAIADSPGCGTGRTGTFALAGQRVT